MYRVQPRKGYFYYRCAGRGPHRKGCGNTIRCDDLDLIVRAWITVISTKPHQTREWVEGQNWDAEIADIKQDLHEAVDAEQFDLLPELQAKLSELRSRETIPGHYEKRDTGITVGEYFNNLDFEGMREYLRTRDIRAEKVPDGIRLVVDGAEVWFGPVSHGVVKVAEK